MTHPIKPKQSSRLRRRRMIRARMETVGHYREASGRTWRWFNSLRTGEVWVGDRLYPSLDSALEAEA